MRKFVLSLFVLLVSVTIQSHAQTVYASGKGEKYHTVDCQLSGDANGMKLAAAKKAGKTACSICKPEEHIKDKIVQCSGRTAEGAQCKRMTADGKCFQHKSN